MVRICLIFVFVWVELLVGGGGRRFRRLIFLVLEKGFVFLLVKSGLEKESVMVRFIVVRWENWFMEILYV